MPLSDKGSRKLPYPLNKTLEPIGDTPNETVDYATVLGFPDETTRVNITLNLSLDEYVALATAIDVGRDIAFADDSELIWFTWVRAFREGTVMACGDVADCIESEIAAGNTELINALTNNNISTGTGGNYNRVNGDVTTVLDRNPPLSLQETINPDFECNLDALWGAIRHGIVERLDDTARDLLEDLAAINDTPQRFQAFIDVIPVLGDIAEGVVTLATEVIPDILNLYDSYSSEAILDEIACDLFAMVCQECRMPTFEELYNYYSTLGYEMSTMEAQTMSAMMSKISTMVGSLQPSSIVYHSMITFQLFTLYLQAQWNGNAGISTITKWAKLGEDFGSNNWLDLCDSCDDQYAVLTLDFKTGQHESYKDGVTVTGAVYVAGEGWRAGVYGSGKRGDICIRFDPTWQIRGVGMKISGDTPAQRVFYRRPNWQSNTGIVSPSAGTSCGEWTGAWDGYLSVSGYKEILFFWTCGANEVSTLEKITIIFDNGFAPGDAIPSSDGTVC